MKKFIALVALLCTVMISSTAMAANWVLIGSSEYYTIYVDNDSIRRDYNYSGYVFRAVIKWIFTDAGRKRVIEQIRLKGQPLPKMIYKLSDSVALYYFKSGDAVNYSDVLVTVYHTREGYSIPELEGSHSEPQWSIIPPGTISEIIFDAVYARVPN